MYWQRFKKMLIILTLFSLVLTGSQCSKQSPQSNEKFFPEAEKQNIDSEQLARAFAAADRIADLRGIAVSRNGIIIAEEYFSLTGPSPDPPLHVMSVTKSISATLIGICIDKGYIQSVDQPLSDFLGAEVDTLNPALGKVSIKQLLTMTCGHDWKEIGPVSEFGDWVTAPDQLIYIFEKPIVHMPGTVFNYSDGAAHLVSAIIQNATGMGTSEFADQYLFGPMGLGERTWYTDNRGISYGGVGLCIGIHDMIAIGNLYLNKGFYTGQQIVSPEWIEECTSFVISTENLIPFLSNYAYYWWLGNAYGHDFICANGYGGQFILIVKELNLVVATRTNWSGASGDKANENWYNVLNIIINQILPSVK